MPPEEGTRRFGARRVLIVQWEFAEHGGAAAQSVAELAAELLRHGHEVELIAQAPRVRVDLVIPAGARLTLTSARGARLARSHVRAWEQLCFFAGVLRRVRRFARDKDCVITLETPSGIRLLGVLIERLSSRRVRHVCWVLDMYRDQSIALGAPAPYAPLRGIRKAVDYLAFARASEVVVIGECMREYLRSRGVTNRVTVIPIWQDAARIHPGDGSRFRRLWNLPDLPILLYSGVATYRHPLLSLVEAARQLNGFTLVLVGRGENIELARQLVHSHRLTNVRIEPPVPASDLNDLLSSGDLHVAVLDRRATGTCVPSKAYAAMAVAKPLLFLGSSRCQVARDIEESGCGATVDGRQLSAVMASIRDWLEDTDHWASRGLAGYRFFQANREMRGLCDRWMDHL